MGSAEAHTALPVVSRTGADWDGIRLEHYRFRAGELPEHSHSRHLIMISMGGNCMGEVRTAGGFSSRDLGRGSVCVIPARDPFAARIEDDAEYLTLFLEPSLVLRAAAESRTSGGVEVIEKCAPSDPVIRGVGLALLAELKSEGLSGRLYAESLANVLAVHLLRHYTAAAGGGARTLTGGLSGQKLRRVRDFIADNYGNDLSLDDLASVANMSTFHFAREFKRATGTTPHQYLIKFRVERAKSLLKESALPLVEISSQSGFSHQSHFTRLFRRLTGTTPQSYRLLFQP